MGRTQVESRVETLPYSWYADPAVAAAERDRIFRRSWQYAGHTGELNGPGSMFPTQVGGLPVVVRPRPGRRAARVPQRLPPPRHGAGERAADARHDPVPVPRVDVRARRLAARRAAQQGGARTSTRRASASCPVQVGTWGPFVFVNPDMDAPPLEAALGNLPEVVAENGLDVDVAPLPPPRPYEIQRELEDRDRELPRVLPLPAQPSGLREGDRRAAPADGGGRAAARASSRRCTRTRTGRTRPTT